MQTLSDNLWGASVISNFGPVKTISSASAILAELVPLLFCRRAASVTLVHVLSMLVCRTQI